MNIQQSKPMAVPTAQTNTGISLFSTCPPSSAFPPDTYMKQVIDCARWSERIDCAGILVYSDNSLMEPWQLAQLIIQNTNVLMPLVAVQPAYMHPYTVAKKIATLGCLYGRKICLNMVAGGFKNDLLALNDTTPHDARYQRLTEYTTIIQRLLRDKEPVTFHGEFYHVEQLKLAPTLDEHLLPDIFVSGSSEAGLAAAKTLGATAIHYPKPVNDYSESDIDPSIAAGIRVGIVCRKDNDDAWQVARARFPEDRKGQLTHQLAMKVSDSAWHKQLSGLGADRSDENPYWLLPFENYKTMCPYLVGNYQRVGHQLQRYYNLGYRTLILDVPGSLEDLLHTRKALDLITRDH